MTGINLCYRRLPRTCVAAAFSVQSFNPYSITDEMNPVLPYEVVPLCLCPLSVLCVKSQFHPIGKKNLQRTSAFKIVESVKN